MALPGHRSSAERDRLCRALYWEEPKGCGEVLAEDPSALWALAPEVNYRSWALVLDSLGGADFN